VSCSVFALRGSVLQYAAVCCSALKCDAVCCSVLQFVAHSNRRDAQAMHGSSQVVCDVCFVSVAVYCRVLHCVVLCCSRSSHVVPWHVAYISLGYRLFFWCSVFSFDVNFFEASFLWLMSNCRSNCTFR